MVLEEETKRIEVVVPDDQLSLAIGRRGQNVRLASQLTGWDIDIMTEAEESEKRSEEFRVRSQDFVEKLDVDEVIAQLLVTEGFSTIEEVAFVPIEELSAIEGFDEEVCSELQQRAKQYLEDREINLTEQTKSAGVAEDLSNLEGLTKEMLLVLAENGIKTLDNLADLASDELLEFIPEGELSEESANEIILNARAHWFDDDEMDTEKSEDTSEDS